MTEAAIQVENLSKRYILGQTRTLRQRLGGMIGRVGGRYKSSGADAREFWALRDVSLDVRPGEVLGLIGRNGAGKSTLLKILSRITSPTHGRVTIRGRVGSLLEVGTGFHPELTGRENIYLNGTILGMRRAEIKKRFDEIVEFAEVGRFLDTPVKRYSSGMYVRLAFAIAAHLEPEILIVDEVLAVGDAAFQSKCMGKMGEVARHGRTVVFVSHNMSAINRICQRAVWVDKGRIQRVGPTDEVVRKYLTTHVAQSGIARFNLNADKLGQLTSLEVLDSKMTPNCTQLAHEAISVRISYRLAEACRQYRVGITLSMPDGMVVYSSASTDTDGNLWDNPAGEYTANLTIPAALLNQGHYKLGCFMGQPSARNRDAQRRGFADSHESALEFQVIGDTRGSGGERWPGVIGLALRWEGAKQTPVVIAA